MRLTWRDGVATLLLAAIVVVALALVRDWGWSFPDSYRAGAVTISILGLGMCATGNSSIERGSMRDPYVALTTVLGVVTLGLAIWAIAADTEASLIALTVSVVALWAVSTLGHALRWSGRGGHASVGTA